MSAGAGRSIGMLPRVLILGGTSEGSDLAARLSSRLDMVTISSLAGRVSQPKLPKGVVRVGGFGGLDGLISYLQSEKISVVVDATHPFAVKRIVLNVSGLGEGENLRGGPFDNWPKDP